MFVSTVLAAAPILLAATPPPGETYDFLGFSHNELLAAWSVQVVEDRDEGARDTYGLVLVVDSVTSDPLQIYRAQPPARTTRTGRPVRVARQVLLADNPRYEAALAEDQWRTLRGRAHFASRRLPMNDSAFRLDPDGDVDLQASAEKKSILLTAVGSSSLGYHAIVRLFDGTLLDAGHFREEAAPGERLGGEVTAYFSRTGYGLAILSRIHGRGIAGERRAAQARVVRFGRAPVATVALGTMRGALTQMELAERIFKRAHPESAGKYDEFVGTHWEDHLPR